MWRGIFSRRDPLDTVEKVDRQRYYQNRRLFCGLHLDSSFKQVSGSLVVAEGCGHWLRLKLAATEFEPVPEIISAAAIQLHSVTDCSHEAFIDLQLDLNEVYNQLIWKLKSSAGKAAEHILAAGLTDPGRWSQQEDSRRYLDSFCAPEALAESCALSIVDALPARDVAVGGYGYPLEPLLIWYLFADRDEKVSKITRIVILAEQATRLFCLPPSDGLDRLVPEIRFRDGPQQGWESLKPMVDEWLANLPDTEQHFELVLTGSQAAGMTDQVSSSFPQCRVRMSDEFEIDASAIESTLAAMFAVAHLDQVPVNLPHLTSAASPRILGRLTPGKPSNWRRVLMNMSDYRPPIMKLRDAV